MSDEKVYRIPRLKFTDDMGSGQLVSRTILGNFIIGHDEVVLACFGVIYTRQCSSREHGCEVAQAWYVERMAQGLEEVPETLTGEQYGRVTKALREDAT